MKGKRDDVVLTHWRRGSKVASVGCAGDGINLRKGELVYIAHRYNDVDAGRVLGNIGVAHLVAYEFIKLGGYPYIPHSDCQLAIMFGRHLPLDYYYKSSMAFLERCDSVAVVIDGKPLSKGVVAEIKKAIELGKKVYRVFVNAEADRIVIEEWKRPVVPAREVKT